MRVTHSSTLSRTVLRNNNNSICLSYLERELESLHDPYDVALVAWALTKADSGKKEAAYNRLHSKRREEGRSSRGGRKVGHPGEGGGRSPKGRRR